MSNCQYTNEGKTKKETLTYLYENSRGIKKLLFNNKTGAFSIGEIGRYKINKKFGLNLPKTITYLTAQDLIGIIDGLLELKYYNRLNDDIDEIKNKQVRCLGDLLQNQFRAGLSKLQKLVVEDAGTSNPQKFNMEFDNYPNPDDWLIDPRPVTNSIKEFLKRVNFLNLWIKLIR